MQCSGLQLSVDPGSRQMGVAVFGKDYKFITSWALKSSREQPAAKRLYLIRKRFEKLWEEHFKDEKIVLTVIEQLPPSQPKASLPISPGAVVSQPYNFSTLGEDTHIPVQTWKAMCRDLGYDHRDPKGIPALKGIGWKWPLPKTDDEADAIILFLCYCWHRFNFLYIGPTTKVTREL